MHAVSVAERQLFGSSRSQPRIGRALVYWQHALPPPIFYKVGQRRPMRQVDSQQIYNIGFRNQTHKFSSLRENYLPQVL